MSLACLLDASQGRCFRLVPQEGGPGEDLGPVGRDYVSQLSWECLGVLLDKLEEMSRARELSSKIIGLQSQLYFLNLVNTGFWTRECTYTFKLSVHSNF